MTTMILKKIINKKKFKLLILNNFLKKNKKEIGKFFASSLETLSRLQMKEIFIIEENFEEKI